MLKSSGIIGISLLIAALAVIAIIIIIVFTETQSAIISSNIIEKKVSEVSVLASRTSIRLTDAATILEITSNLPQVAKPTNVSLINQNENGISANQETEKRSLARSLMRYYPNFETISLLLPNGDVYFIEPFESQKNTTLKNFAFRDYYKGVMATDKSYLSEAIRSNATGHIVSVIAVPIHNPANGSLIGIWIGAIDLSDISKVLRYQISSSELVAYLDQHGQKVATSNEYEYFRIFNSNTSQFHTPEKIIGLKDGVPIKSGYSIQNINGMKMFIAYSPLQALSTRWTVFSLEPFDKVFLTVNTLKFEGAAMCAIIAILAIVIALVLQKSFSSLDKLTVKLHRSNTELSTKEKELETAKHSLEEKNKQLEKVNRQLHLREKTQRDFINVAAHELRTPIVPILNLSELLYSKFKRRNKSHIENILQNENKKIEEIVQVIMRNAYRLFQLTEDILDVTKIETQALKLSMEQLDLNQLLGSLVEDFRKNNETRTGVYVTYNQKSNFTLVKIDKGRILQVVTNLLNNAMKFTKQGKIQVSLENKNYDKGQVIVSVEDSGTGIDPEIYPRLFSKFATKSDEGTGLGLYISRKIIEAHGGKIWGANNPDGKGSTFYFTLPLASNGSPE